MTPTQMQLHREHLERQTRINLAAYRPVIPVPVWLPEPEAPTVAAAMFYEPPAEPITRKPGPVTFDEIRRAVCNRYGVSWREIKSGRRHWRLIVPRFVIAYLAYTTTALTLPQLGRLMDRDHTTILHAVKTALPARMDRDPELAAEVRKLKTKLEEMAG